MNRRGMFKKVAALAVALPFAPAAWKGLHAERPYAVQCNSSPCPIAGVYQPPPEDTRSPEQVVVDARTERIRYTVQDLMREYPGRQRFNYHVDASVLTGVAHQLGLDGTPFEMREVFGVLSIVCNGNVLSIA